jgi:hypothetical protein
MEDFTPSTGVPAIPQTPAALGNSPESTQLGAVGRWAMPARAAQDLADKNAAPRAHRARAPTERNSIELAIPGFSRSQLFLGPVSPASLTLPTINSILFS